MNGKEVFRLAASAAVVGVLSLTGCKEPTVAPMPPATSTPTGPKKPQFIPIEELAADPCLYRGKEITTEGYIQRLGRTLYVGEDGVQREKMIYGLHKEPQRESPAIDVNTPVDAKIPGSEGFVGDIVTFRVEVDGEVHQVYHPQTKRTICVFDATAARGKL